MQVTFKESLLEIIAKIPTISFCFLIVNGKLTS